MIDMRCPRCHRLMFQVLDDARAHATIRAKCTRKGSRNNPEHCGLLEYRFTPNEGYDVTEIKIEAE